MNQRHLLKSITAYLIALSAPVHAASTTWVGQSPNSDMNNPLNWNASTVPSSGDNPLFNSSLPNTETHLIENATAFVVSNFIFPSQASPFTFNFNRLLSKLSFRVCSFL